MEISPDHIIYFSFGLFKLNATIVYTWLVMVLLVLFSWFVTRRVTSSAQISDQQNLLEVLVGGLLSQIKDATNHPPEKFLPLLGTLFIFILISNLLSAVPGFKPPTGSLSTTSAFSLIVFFRCSLLWYKGERLVELFKKLRAAFTVYAAVQHNR